MAAVLVSSANRLLRVWPTSTVLDPVTVDSQVDSSFGDARLRGTDAARTSRPQKRHGCHDDRVSHGNDGRASPRRHRRSVLSLDGVDGGGVEKEMRIENQKATNNRRRQTSEWPRGKGWCREEPAMLASF